MEKSNKTNYLNKIKEFIKNNKSKIIAFFSVAAILIFAFWYGGDAPGSHGWQMQTQSDENTKVDAGEENTDFKTEHTDKEENAVKSEESDSRQENSDKEKSTVLNTSDDSKNKKEDTGSSDNTANSESVNSDSKRHGENTVENTDKDYEKNVEYSKEQGMNIDETTGMDEHQTEPVPDGKPVPIEPENSVISDKKMECVLSVRCDTVLNNIDMLDKNKIDIIPKDGVILPETKVTFYEGESVFNVLVREMKRNKIHMEFTNTPIYNSAYIEGIANLYEFDCGELSGWMYSVNGWFPNYGCSRYRLNLGDKVEMVYTCDLGYDVGGGYSARNGY